MPVTPSSYTGLHKLCQSRHELLQYIASMQPVASAVASGETSLVVPFQATESKMCQMYSEASQSVSCYRMEPLQGTLHKRQVT